VKVVAERYKEDVKFWITLNEPEIYSMNSYLRGIWPPQKKGIINFYIVMRNLTKSHRRAYRIIKKINPKAQIGIAKNNTYFEAANDKFVNRTLKKLADKYWNDYFLDKITHRQDFIGLNYYFHDRIDNGFKQNENKKVSDLNWELYPQGIYHVLRDLKKYGKPIYITENGLADAEDKYRAWYIEEILKNVGRAIKDGADVRGYFHWSLLDNFEWAHGFWPRFGLIEVDYKTQERTLRKSAQKYSELIKKYSRS
jgi:beta-glucosidase